MNTVPVTKHLNAKHIKRVCRGRGMYAPHRATSCPVPPLCNGTLPVLMEKEAEFPADHGHVCNALSVRQGDGGHSWPKAAFCFGLKLGPLLREPLC